MIWLIALLLVVLAGLNAPLAAFALSLAALNGLTLLRPDLAWIGSPWLALIALAFLTLQLLADLYFVPITVKDRMYLNPQRTHNNYLHARVQSFLRPLVGAFLAAALPLPAPDWTTAVFGFTCATGVYWLSAWIRENVAMMRGALVLLAWEALKNALLIVLALLTFWLPLLALLLLLWMLLQTIAWTTRLQREQWLYVNYGGQRAGEDT
jgi:uncharacterized membrane protein